MPIIYVVGPSGAGKSELCERSYMSLGALWVDLDSEVKEWLSISHVSQIPHMVGEWENYWKAMSDILPKLEEQQGCSAPLILVDVGAGALETQQGRDFLIKRGDRMVCINAELVVLKNRLKHADRSLEDLRYHEFREERKLVYLASAETVNTSDQTIEKSVSCFIAAVRRLVP